MPYIRRIQYVLIAAITTASVGCATTTTITTEQPGAKVVRQADKVELGVTPYTYTSEMWLWESEKLEVTGKGGSAVVEMKRSEVDMLPMVGGVCLSLTGCGLIAGVPVILAGGMKLPEKTEVVLSKKQSLAPVERDDAVAHYQDVASSAVVDGAVAW